jgi:FAD/FMN-containing dehydrogenase
VNADDLAFFRETVGGDGVLTDVDELAPMNEDWMCKYRGHSSLALLPRSTAEVAALLRHCHRRHLALVPQGGNTGLVGGSVPRHRELILSLRRMHRIQEFDPASGVVSCEVGCPSCVPPPPPRV